MESLWFAYGFHMAVFAARRGYIGGAKPAVATPNAKRVIITAAKAAGK